MNLQRLRPIVQNITLLFGSLIFSLIVVEIGFRVLDPTPFFSDFEINNTEHGNLSVYDDALGWEGVPNEGLPENMLSPGHALECPWP
jgi:hypothetical protein